MSTTVKKIYLFGLVFLYSWAVWGQKDYQNINTADGLPTSVTNKIVQDNRGFIWIATGAGLCRYDGTTITTFTEKDGCPENEILNLFVDKAGFLWVSPYTGDILLMRNDSFFTADNLPRLNVHPRPRFVSNFHEDKAGNVWLTDGNLYKYSSSNAAIIVKEELVSCFDFSQIEENKYLILNMGKVSILDITKNNLEVILAKTPIERIIRTDCIWLNEHQRLISFRDHNNIAFYLLDIRTNKIEELGSFSTKNRIYSQQVLDDNQLYVCTSAGVYVMDPTKQGLANPPKDTLLRGKYVCSVFKDSEDVMWFATQNEGIFLKKPSESNSMVTVENKSGFYGIAGSSQMLMLGGKNENFYHCSKTDFSKSAFTQSVFNADAGLANDYKSVLYDGERYFWIAGDGDLQKFDVNTGKTTIFPNCKSAKAIARRKNGKLLLGTSNSLCELDPDEPPKRQVLLKKRTLAVAEDSEEHIWSGHLDGLFTHFKNGKVKNWGEKYPPLAGRITNICISDENVAWVGTHIAGVFIIKADTTIQIGMDDGMPSNLCNRIKLRGENEAFITTNLGLVYLKISSWMPFKLETRIFNTSNGLSSNDTWDVHVDGNYAWVTTLKGVERIDLNNLPDFTPPKVYLTKCLINNRPVKEFDLQSLHYSQNNISFLVSGISFKNQGNLAYRFLLQTDNKMEWVTTSNPFLSFFALAPDDYEMKVMVQSSNGAWSTEPATLSFRIRPPFWQTPWFRVCFSILMLGSVYLAFRYYKTSIEYENNQKLLLRQQIYDMEITALKAQMNPHFIFNCLNSIQKYIVKKDFVSSNIYLSRFSKLIRKSMELAKLDRIELADELVFLEDYIKLESMRFDNSFEYKAFVDQYINTNQVEIPTMLIQPLVENAINHGLIPMKEQAGTLHLNIKKDANRLIITIEDNGIGIEESYRRKKYKAISHNSSGIYILRHRIEVINKILNEPIELRIYNPTDQNKTGTIAELSLPIMHTKQINQ